MGNAWPTMKPGDVLLTGSNTILGDITKKVTNSLYSHCGIIADMGFDGQTNLMFAESISILKLPDEEYNRIVMGVQLHWLERRLDFNASADKDDVWLFPIKEPLTQDESTAIAAFLQDLHDRHVEYDYLSYFCLGFELLTGIQLHRSPSKDAIFCSELVCETLQLIGRVPKDLNPVNQTPADVSMFSCFGDPIKIF